MLNNIRIVLIQTYHPGNIGSAARAMKTMGLTNLWLVRPRCFPDPEATAMAANAEDLLEQATVVENLEDAIADCPLVIGTSARERTFSLPPLEPRQMAEQLLGEASKHPVALVFGRERMGLHNDEIQQCHFQVNIPANPDYPVLNIASAIQVLCYEIYQTSLNPVSIEQQDDYPLHKELNLFYQHLEQTLTDIQFINQKHPGNTMDRLIRVFRKARPDSKELNLLRGVLSKIQSLKDDSQPPS